MFELTNKIKENLVYVNKGSNTRIIVIISIIAIISFTIIGFTYGKYNPDPNSEVVQELLNKMLTDEKLKYEQIINGKDNEINTINKQLELSMSIIQNNKKEITNLKNKIKNIKPPENEKEIRSRLKDLGYETK